MILRSDDFKKYRGKVIMVDGCFDPLHVGHIKYFEFAASFGIPVFCNVETDSYIREYRKRPSLLPQEQRIEIIDAIKYITYTHLQETTTTDVLKLLRPIKYVKGDDWKKKVLPKDELKACKDFGIEIVYTNKNFDSSTALIKKFIKSVNF